MIYHVVFNIVHNIIINQLHSGMMLILNKLYTLLMRILSFSRLILFIIVKILLIYVCYNLPLRKLKESIWLLSIGIGIWINIMLLRIILKFKKLEKMMIVSKWRIKKKGETFGFWLIIIILKLIKLLKIDYNCLNLIHSNKSNG